MTTLKKMFIAAVGLFTVFPVLAVEVYSGYAIIEENPLPATCFVQTVYRQVKGRTVADGLQEILQGTGYRLAGVQAADPELKRLLSQPYPDYYRQVGPAPMVEVLERVSGGAWRLVVDPVNRLVSYEVHEHYRCGAGNAAVCVGGRP